MPRVCYARRVANYEYIFVNRTENLDVDLRVEGSLPNALTGTFYAMVNGGCEVGDTALHPLDSHGRVVAVSIANGKASLRARMVETPLWKAEKSASAIVKRRLFANKPGRWSNLFDAELANAAGHNVVPWGKALLATNDPGFFELDPVTLETRGAAALAPAKGAFFSPMPRRDPATGRLVLFEVRPGFRDTLVVHELDETFKVAQERTYKLPRGASFFHDVAMTENYYLVMQWASLSLPTFLWGAAVPMEAFRFDGASTPMLYLLPRAGGAPIAVNLPGGRTHFHFWNAFEADGRVVADTIGYAGQVDFKSSIPPKARRNGSTANTPASSNLRYRIDPKSGQLEVTPLTDTPAEAPEIHPERRGRPYRYGWAPTAGSRGDEEDPNIFLWFHALARHDFEARTTQQWDAGKERYVSAAAFAPRSGGTAEDDGHVLALLQDAKRGTSSLAIFDAADVTKGPVAELTGAGLLGAVSHVAFA